MEKEMSLLWCPELSIFRLRMYGSEWALTEKELKSKFDGVGGTSGEFLSAWLTMAKDNPDVTVDWKE
jgi:hypothetical protein